MNHISDAMNMLSEANQEYERMKLTQKRIYDILVDTYGTVIENEKRQVIENENAKLKGAILEMFKLGSDVTHDKMTEIVKRYGISIDTSKLQ